MESKFKFRPFRGRYIHNLYYITHIDNVPSIITHGILSHNQVEQKGINYTQIYNKDIVANRQQKTIPIDSKARSLWFFANLYFQPRNPMLFRVLATTSSENIAILAIDKKIIDRDDIYITDGNAANMPTQFYTSSDGKKIIAGMTAILNKEYWTEESGDKRKIMAECLVPESVSPDYIQTIYVVNHEIAKKVRRMGIPSHISIVPQPDIFFQPTRKIDISENLSVVDGDMFFSRMHTLTVSVNCVGIMGKGLASRAKWQFPDVYVQYQYVCRTRSLQMGKPYLYKRESSLDYQLADEPETLKNGNGETWFLLFATKQHWRENADINGIEKGLQWLKDNYEKEGIKSLAIPALGCGLGRLDWKDVGPLMVKYLSDFNIQVMIYLPAEKKIPDEYLTKEFLLHKKD